MYLPHQEFHILWSDVFRVWTYHCCRECTGVIDMFGYKDSLWRLYSLHIYITIYLYFILPIHHCSVIHRKIPPASAAHSRHLRPHLF